jgi:hypothetical protein
MQTITRIYDDYDAAQSMVQHLHAAGISEADISLVANDADNRFADRERGGNDVAETAGTGAGVGATLGGAAGLLAGLGIMAIPGIGPVVAAGWLASTALGAAVGGAAGGLVGALTQSGVSEADANLYAEGVRRGGSLVTVRVGDNDRERVEAILDKSAVDPAQRVSAYRQSGWERFDEGSKGLTAEEIRRERELYKR